MNITFTGLSPSMVSFSKLFKLSKLSCWPSPLSLATTHGVSIDFFSSGYLDVSVLQVHSLYLWIQYKVAHEVLGFPIRKFSDQSLHTAPRNLSQYTTSFIVLQCQGIRQSPLNAWFIHRKKFFCYKLNFCFDCFQKNMKTIGYRYWYNIYDLKKLNVSILVEDSGIEPLTSWMQIRRSPSWANPPINWWAEEDSNFRPHPYQGCALTTWATGPYIFTQRH